MADDKNGKGKTEKPRSTGKPQLILRSGSISIINYRFFRIPLVVTAIGKGGSEKPDCEVKLFNGLTQFGPIVNGQVAPVKTDNDGKASFNYEGLNTDFLRNNFEGKEIKLRAEAVIDGIHTEGEIAVKLNLPAGGIEKGLQAAKIRRYHLLGDVVKATLLTAFAITFLGYGGGAKTNIILGILFGGTFLWVAHYKLKGWTWTKKIVVSAALPVACFFVPGLITDLMIFAVLYAYFFGGFLYFLEELWRRPDGDPVINVYPWWGLYIAGSFILFNIFGFIAGFIPGVGATGDIDILRPIDWSMGVNIAQNSESLLGLIKKITFNDGPVLGNIIKYALAIVFLAIYAIPTAAMEFLSGKGKITTAEGQVTGLVIIAHLWNIVKGWFVRTKKGAI
jgi:hypothetical protein